MRDDAQAMAARLILSLSGARSPQELPPLLLRIRASGGLFVALRRPLATPTPAVAGACLFLAALLALVSPDKGQRTRALSLCRLILMYGRSGALLRWQSGLP
jgi:hypothetical protein